MKQKKVTINPKNKGDECLKYKEMVALIFEKIKWNPERFSNLKPFINKYKWKGINYPSEKNDWKAFEKNNLIIIRNILYIKEKEICPSCISKINSNCEKQIILLMIPNEEKESFHYLAVKKLSALPRGII